MPRDSKELMLRIEELKAAIRKKYQEYKSGVIMTEQTLEKKYKPIITELRQSRKEEEDDEEEDVQPVKKLEFSPSAYSSPKASSTVEQSTPRILSTDEGQQEATRFIQESFANPLTQRFMLRLMKDIGGTKRTIDHTFGPRYEGNTLMVGDKPLQFDDDGSIRIDDVLYKPTEGLYELLFKRIPDEDVYTERDLDAYKDILLKTNGHKKGYRHSAHVNRDNSQKYKMVISKLFPKQLYSGTGPLLKQVGSRDVIYWDDPNELCDRLRALVASTETGNRSHRNEIINIVEELKEAKIISGRGNRKYASLLQ